MTFDRNWKGAVVAVVAGALSPGCVLAQAVVSGGRLNVPINPTPAHAAAGAGAVHGLPLAALTLPASALVSAAAMAPMSKQGAVATPQVEAVEPGSVARARQRVIGFGRAGERRTDPAPTGLPRPIGFGRAGEEPSGAEIAGPARPIGFGRGKSDGPSSGKSTLAAARESVKGLSDLGQEATGLRLAEILSRLYEGDAARDGADPPPPDEADSLDDLDALTEFVAALHKAAVADFPQAGFSRAEAEAYATHLILALYEGKPPKPALREGARKIYRARLTEAVQQTEFDRILEELLAGLKLKTYPND